MANYDNLINAGIDTESLLKRLMGNESLIRVFVSKFIDDKTFEELKAAFENKDMKEAEIKSHTLKGVCGNLSITVLYELFSEQTNLIRSGKYEKAEEMMSEITQMYNSTVLHMKIWVNEE